MKKTHIELDFIHQQLTDGLVLLTDSLLLLLLPRTTTGILAAAAEVLCAVNPDHCIDRERHCRPVSDSSFLFLLGIA